MFTVFWLNVVFASVVLCRAESGEGRLIQDLLVNYDKKVKPTDTDPNLNFTVNINLHDLRILKLDVTTAKLTTKCSVSQEWTDKRLSWRPRKYDKIRMVHWMQKSIWTPDTILANGSGIRSHPSCVQSLVNINSSGQVLWTCPAVLTSWCHLNMEAFPFDQHVCHLDFVSETYSGEEMELLAKSHELKLSHIQNSEWRVARWEVKESTTLSLFQSASARPLFRVTLELNRASFMPAIHLMAACGLVALLATLSVIIPGAAGEKCTLGALLLLAAIFLSVSVRLKYPYVVNTFNIWNVSQAGSMIIAACACLYNLISLCVHHGGLRGVGVSGCARNVYLRGLKRCLCIKMETPKSLVRDKLTMLYPCGEMPTAEDIRLEWAQVSHVMDRTALVVFIVLIGTAVGMAIIMKHIN